MPSPLTPGTTLIPRTKNKSNSTPHLPRAIAAAAPAENMLGFLIDAHEKRPGVEHELIREARDRERWLIFFLVCAGYAVLQTAARFPDEFDALTSFPASERQYYKALAWARAARRSLLNSLAALLAALLLERIRRRVARRGASSARKYERRRRQQRPRLPPELWAQVLGDFLPAQQVALLACCGGDVGAASASEETWRVVHRRDSGVVAAYSLPTAHAAHTVGDKPGAQSYKEAHSRLAASWAARAVLGGNVEGENVLVALRGAVYDLTRFAPDHPGSTDTLLDFAGAGPVPESSRRRRDAGRRASARRRGGRRTQSLTRSTSAQARTPRRRSRPSATRARPGGSPRRSAWPGRSAARSRPWWRSCGGSAPRSPRRRPTSAAPAGSSARGARPSSRTTRARASGCAGGPAAARGPPARRRRGDHGISSCSNSARRRFAPRRHFLHGTEAQTPQREFVFSTVDSL